MDSSNIQSVDSGKQQSVDSKLILGCVDEVFKEARNIIEAGKSLESVEEPLNIISAHFGTTQRESFLFVVLFGIGFQKGSRGEYIDLTDHFSNFTYILQLREDLESLYKKGIVSKYGPRRRIEAINVKYRIKKNVILDMLENKPFSRELLKEQDIYSLLENIVEMTRLTECEFGTTRLLTEGTMEILQANADIPLIGAILKMNLKSDLTLVYVCLIWYTMERVFEMNASYLLESIYDSTSLRITNINSMSDGSNELIVRGLVESRESSCMSELMLKLSDYSINFAAEYGVLLHKTSKKRSKIEPLSITPKVLIFNDKEIKELITVKKLLSDDFFENMSKQTGPGNLPEGITAILYGGPGTGKTESVLQIARETGREIMKVDISQTKSMWYGESEKSVKKIFSDYNIFLKESARAPILFINEADALLSIRSESSDSAVRNTENTVQNILLEELEGFKGILFATTNLVQNLDRAFDRRFLFKIFFPEPDSGIRARIWKDKKPDLSDDVCSRLAREFQLSGGEIENIVRKLDIEEAIQGGELEIEEIVEICRRESMRRKGKRGRIGF